MHYCGSGNAFIESMCESSNLFGVHCSQPELNNMELLVESTSSNGIALLGLPEEYVPDSLQTGVIVLR